MRNNLTSTRGVVLVGLSAALVVVLTFIRIPLGTAMVHLGSAGIMTCAIVLGGPIAGAGAAIGSAVFDLIGGVSPYTVWSFFIKGAMGLTVGMIAHAGRKNGTSTTMNAVACVCGAIVSLIGYEIAWTFVLGSFAAALANIPASLLTSGVGLLVSLPLSYALLRAFGKNRP